MRALHSGARLGGRRRAAALPGLPAVVAVPIGHAAGGGSSTDEIIFVVLLGLILGGLAVWDILRRKRRNEAEEVKREDRGRD